MKRGPDKYLPTEPVSGVTFDATVQHLEPTVAGLAKAAHTARSAARNVCQELGSMFCMVDPIRELEGASKGTLEELEDAERRLCKVCGEKSASPKKDGGMEFMGERKESAMFKKSDVDITIQNPRVNMQTEQLIKETLISMVKTKG